MPTAPPGLIDAQITQVKKTKIDGKKVIVPEDNAPENAAPPLEESMRELRKKKKPNP
jgi:hypothetical protein